MERLKLAMEIWLLCRHGSWCHPAAGKAAGAMMSNGTTAGIGS
jgi:hypothetical protein